MIESYNLGPFRAFHFLESSGIAWPKVPVVQRLCSSLALELEGLDRVSREDLADLDQAVKQFVADEAELN